MSRHPLHVHPLRGLFTETGARSRRASSWDRSGGNWDFLVVGSGETVTLLEHDRPGCVMHSYCALAFPELTDYRDAIPRCYWYQNGFVTELGLYGDPHYPYGLLIESGEYRDPYRP